MLNKLLHLLDRFIPAETAYAHCDIPCGIYSSHPAQIAADTVVRMNEKIRDLGEVPPQADREKFLAYQNSLIRMIMVKEEHAQICKRELLILWTDYFKEDHLEMFSNLHEIFWQAAKLCSKNKQEINLDTALKLRQVVHEIGHMFETAEKLKKK